MLLLFLGIIIALAVAAVLATLLVIFAARIFGAKRAGFGFSLLAIIVSFTLTAIIRALLSDGIPFIILYIFIGSAIYAYILGAPIIKGSLINVVSLVIFLIFTLSLAHFKALP